VITPAVEAVDEMPKTLLAEDGQRRRDTVENTFNVDVDHILPILNAQVVEKRYRGNASVANENVKFTVSITSQLDELRQVFAPFNVSACVGRFTAGILNAGHQRLQPIQSPGPKYNRHTTLREQECCGPDLLQTGRQLGAPHPLMSFLTLLLVGSATQIHDSELRGRRETVGEAYRTSSTR
jgi:hypothetical protein